MSTLFPDVVKVVLLFVGLNAGLGAYPSWGQTLVHIKVCSYILDQMYNIYFLL